MATSFSPPGILRTRLNVPTMTRACAQYIEREAGICNACHSNYTSAAANQNTEWHLNFPTAPSHPTWMFWYGEPLDVNST